MEIDNNLQQNQKSLKTTTTIVLVILLAGLIIFLLAFHIVIDGGITFVAKDHLTFSETIVNVEDIIRQYNSLNFLERMSGQGIDQHLVQKLIEKGLIVKQDDKKENTPPFNSSIPTSTEPSQQIQELSIENSSYKLMETSDILGSKYAWKATIRNHTDRPIIFTIQVTFLDEDGFEIATDSQYRETLQAGEQKGFTGSRYLSKNPKQISVQATPRGY
ncbi:MAG: FxLYD domain-containing protein [Bacteroidota bacterium]|jgi:hypothetical protein